jgi:3-hydroxy-9,10-secoandrosta-1,3,5(10)-triene-9,17-dione monooxygenase
MSLDVHQRNAPSREELIERARALVPKVRERAPEADRLRRIPAATQDELMAAGLYRIYLPRRFGGYESDYMLQVDLAAELGRGCGSTAWVHSVVASHSWMHGMFDPRAQDEVWRDDPDALLSGSTPTGDAKVDAVDGGFLLNGRWTFASGVDVCSWNHFNMMTPRLDGPGVEHRYGLASLDEVEIVDDWYTTGLRGTGSKSMICRDLFIPEYRTIRSEACRGEPTPGSAVNSGPIYRMPLFSLFGKGIVAPAVGIARGALDLTLERLGGQRLQSGARLADEPTAQLRIGEAAAEIEAAWFLLERDCREVHARAEADHVPTLEERHRWRRNDAYAGNLCVQAVDRLMTLLGAQGNSEGSAIQRHWRDIHALASHIALAWDAQGANYGRVLLGLASRDSKL